MIRWLYLVLASVPISFLLSLGVPQARLDNHLHVAWNPSGTMSVSTPSITSLTSSAESTFSRAGALESFVAHSGLFATNDIGPPWLEYRGPPLMSDLGLVARSPVRPAAQAMAVYASSAKFLR